MRAQDPSAEKVVGHFEDDTGVKPVVRLWLIQRLSQRVTRPFTRFYEHLHTEQAFADYVAKRLDTLIALFRFTTVIVVTVLIFVINERRYGAINQS